MKMKIYGLFIVAVVLLLAQISIATAADASVTGATGLSYVGAISKDCANDPSFSQLYIPVSRSNTDTPRLKEYNGTGWTMALSDISVAVGPDNIHPAIIDFTPVIGAKEQASLMPFSRYQYSILGKQVATIDVCQTAPGISLDTKWVGVKVTELASSLIIRQEGESCGGIAANLIRCAPGLVCQLAGNYPDAGGKCAKPATNKPPVISGISAPANLKVDETASWSISAYDPEGGALYYTANWGDGSINGPFKAALFSHMYSSAGTYNPTFTVADDQGATATSSATVSVVGKTECIALPNCIMGTTPSFAGYDANGCKTFNCIPIGGTKVDVSAYAEPSTVDLYSQFTVTAKVAYVSAPSSDTGAKEKKFKVVTSYTDSGYSLAAATKKPSGTIRLSAADDILQTLARVFSTNTAVPAQATTPQAAPTPANNAQPTQPTQPSAPAPTPNSAQPAPAPMPAPAVTTPQATVAIAPVPAPNSAQAAQRAAPIVADSELTQATPAVASVAAIATKDPSLQERVDYVTLSPGDSTTVSASFTSKTPGGKKVSVKVYLLDSTGCLTVDSAAERKPYDCPIEKLVAETSAPVVVSLGTQPPAPPQDEATGTLYFNAGWNMVSVPVDAKVSMKNVADRCGTAAYAWKLTSSGYVKADALEPGYGYWVKGTQGCKYDVSAQSYALSLSQLSPGWNLVGSPGREVAVSDYSGSCQITSGPWYYPASGSPYVYSSRLSPGKAYWVQVSSACGFSGASEEKPPAPPQ